MDIQQIYNEEWAKQFGAFALNHSLKENGIMKSTTEMTEALFDTTANANEPTDRVGSLEAALAERRDNKMDILGATEPKEVSGDTMATILGAKEKLGLGDEVSIQQMVEATETPIKPLTKKQQKQQKHMMKNMQKSMRQYQRQGQAAHIMNKLFQHSIQTKEQVRQLHATALAKEELVTLLGPRQSDAFFSAKPDTLCTAFFPKPTVAANPTLMIDKTGESRTLAEMYEYYIYKHYCVLEAAAEDKAVETPNLSVDWATEGDIPAYVPLVEAEPVASPIQ